MNTKSIRAWLVVSMAACISGCTSYDVQTNLHGDPGWGDANRATYAAQVIDPDPVYPDANPTTSAEHAAQAVERYRTDQVKEPDKVRTTENISGGSGSS